jgi:HK97 family phage major capsid protein
VIRLLRLVKDSQNRYIWEPSVQVGQPDRVYGKPIYEQNDLAQSELYAGDWSYYIIGDRQQIVVETTREGGDAWRRNATEIKAVERVDGECVLTSAFGKLTAIN